MHPTDDELCVVEAFI